MRNQDSDKPTLDQLSIRTGDQLAVTKDNGSIHRGVAQSEPWPLSGHTWVIMVSGISGCYDLTRCQKEQHE